MASENTPGICKISEAILVIIEKQCDKKALVSLASTNKHLRAQFAPKVFGKITIQGPQRKLSDQLRNLTDPIDAEELATTCGYVNQLRIVAWPVPRDRRQNWTYAHDRSGRVSDEDAVPYPPLASRVNRSIRELPNLRRLSLNLEGFTEAQNEYIIDVMSYAQPWVQVDHLRVIASEETEAAIIEHSRVRTPGTQSRLRSLQMSHGMRSQGYLQARRHHGNLERLYINLRFDRGRQDGRHCELYNILDHENPDPDDENEPVSLDPLLDADYVTPTGPNDPYSLSRTLRTMRPIQLRLIARHFPRLQWLVITEQAPPEFFPSTLRGPSFRAYIRAVIRELQRFPNLTRLSFTVWQGAAEEGRQVPHQSTGQPISVPAWYHRLIRTISDGVPQLRELCIMIEYPHFYQGVRPEGAAAMTITRNRFVKPSLTRFPMGLMQ